MPAFTTDDDLRRYVGGIFEVAFADPDLGPRLAATGLVLRVDTTDPAAALTIDCANGMVGLGDLGLTPDATMTMSSADANAFWQGRVNLPVAMARRRITVDGRMGALLTLVPQTKPLFATYLSLLERDGRGDLLVPA